MTNGRPIVDDPEAALAELTQRTRPPWLKPDESLPFEKLTGDEFEVFCYQLVSDERPERRVFYYGRTADGGRDIMAETADGRVELIQCKCFSRDISVDVVRADLAKVFTNIHLGIIPKRPDRIVFYAAPKLSPTANDLLMDQGQWLAICEAELKAQWTKRNLTKKHGPFPAELLDFARTWWPETDVVPGVKLTERTERHPELIERFFGLRSPPNSAALDDLRHELLVSREQLSRSNDRELKRAEELFEQGNYQGAADFLEGVLDELAGGATPENCTRRVRARLHLVGCWINLRDHVRAKAVFQQIRMTDLDRAERNDQLRYARMRLMLDHTADVSRWSTGEDARPLRQTQAILRGQPPEEPIDHPDVLLLAAGTALFDGRLNDVVRFACPVIADFVERDLLRVQALHFLILALGQTMVEGGVELIPVEERGPLLERIENQVRQIPEHLHPPADRIAAAARAAHAWLALLGPVDVPRTERGDKALPVAGWFRVWQALVRAEDLPGLERLAREWPERALIEASVGELLRRANRLAEAIEHARIAYRFLPSQRHRFLLARCLDQARQWEEAWHLAEPLPDERADVRLLKASLLAVLPQEAISFERRWTLLQGLRALSPEDPEVRTAPALALANQGRLDEAADAAWEDAEWLWEHRIGLPVSTLAQIKELQRIKDDATRYRRWKRIAHQLVPMRTDPEAEHLYLGLFFDLEWPADLPSPDLGRLTEAGYGKFVAVDDLVALIENGHRLRIEWSAGRLPLDSPWRLPSESQIVDEVVRGELVWPAPAEVHPLHNKEYFRAVHPDVEQPDTVLLGLFELYLLAEVDGLDHLGPVKVATFYDCLTEFKNDRPAHSERRQSRRHRLESMHRDEEGQGWRRLVWPNADSRVDEGSWAAGQEAILVQDDGDEGTTPETLIASLLHHRRVPASERAAVEVWLQAAGSPEPLVRLPHPRVALSAEVIDHRIVDLLDVLLYAFDRVLLTPRAVAALEQGARRDEDQRRKEARWMRLRQWLQRHPPEVLERPSSEIFARLPEQAPKENRQWVAHILSWHEALATQPTWRLACADRFIHGLFTHFSDNGLRALLGTQQGMGELAERYRRLRGRVTTLGGHLAQMGADLEVLRRLARLGDIGLARFSLPFDPLWLEPDEVALNAMQRTLASSSAPVSAWFCWEVAKAALRWWGERSLKEAQAALRRALDMLEALGRFRGMLHELVSGALVDVDAQQRGILNHLLDEVIARPAYLPTLRVAFAQAISKTSRMLGATFPGRLALRIGMQIENRLAEGPGQAFHPSSFWGTMETLAIWSGAWGDRSLEALVLISESGVRLDAETLLRRAGRSRQRRVALRAPWLLEVSVPGSKKADPFRVVLPPAALLLRMSRHEAAKMARELAAHALEDGALREALLAFAKSPEEPKVRDQLADAEATSPVRLFSHAPGDFADWGLFQFSASAALSRIQDFRALLSEVPWQEQSGEDHLRRLIGPEGEWRRNPTLHGLAFHLAEIPGQHLLAAIEERVSGLPPEQIFREAQGILSTVGAQGAGLAAWMVAQAWWVAHQHPEIAPGTGQPNIRTREIVSQLVEGILVGLAAAPSNEGPPAGDGGTSLSQGSDPSVAVLSTLGRHELGLLRLCRHIVGRCVDAPFNPWPERLWLAWRLHIWLLHQLAALDPRLRVDTIEQLAMAGMAAPLVKLHSAFDPAAIQSSRDLRLFQILGALVMMGSHLKQSGDLEFSPITDRAAVMLLDLASEGPTNDAQEPGFPLFPWPRPVTVPELAVQVLLLLRQEDWLKLAPVIRLKWLERLTDAPVAGLNPSLGWALVAAYGEDFTLPELKLAAERLVDAERSPMTAAALVAVLVADESLSVPEDLDKRISKALVQEPDIWLFAGRLRLALARAPETFEAVARAYFAQAPDPIPLAQGLSLLVTRPEPDVAQATRALVATLSKEAPFCNDPRMQTLFDLTGVT